MNSELVRVFVNGQAMFGGSLHEPLAEHGRLLGRVRTAARYRFWSYRDEFPALEPVTEGGWCVPGELYAVEYEFLCTKFLPREPPELELAVILLEDARGALSMRLRDTVSTDAPDWTAIEPGTGWRSRLGLRERA
ncbi:allophanate hydrolase-related protein [Spirillospora sp. CA-255316]